MLHKDRTYHKGKTRLVFAGQESLNGYQQMAVKFEKNDGFSTQFMPRPRVFQIRLPDRTLYLYGKGAAQNVLLPFPVDAVVSTKRDLNHNRALESDILLFNPIHAAQSLDVSALRRAGIEVLVDSGGFQLAQGTTDFVDPNDTIAFYNKHATMGMGLDFPTSYPVDKLLYKKNCKLQRLNNEYIRERLLPRVTLCPIVHGGSCKTKEHCLEQVYKKGRDTILAVADMPMRRGAPIEIVKQKFDSLALVLHHTRKEVSYYHLLGATSVLWFTINRLLVATGYVNSIGGDSVSHRQNAIGGSYSLYPHFDGPTSLTQPVATEVAAQLPCPCPVCSLAKDARILRDFRLSELHHMYAAISNKTYVENNVDQYVAGKLSRSQLWDALYGAGAKGNRGVMDIALNFFEDVVSKGYDKVKKFTPYEGVSLNSVSLFAGGASSVKKEVLDRYASIHAKYGKFHGQVI